jgi:hypothetical protein
MSRPDLLYEVKILETDKNSVTYRGELTEQFVGGGNGGGNGGRRCGGAVSSDSD